MVRVGVGVRKAAGALACGCRQQQVGRLRTVGTVSVAGTVRGRLRAESSSSRSGAPWLWEA